MTGVNIMRRSTIVTSVLIIVAITVLYLYKSTAISERTIPVCESSRLSSIHPIGDFKQYPCLGDHRSIHIPDGCVRTVCREGSHSFFGLKDKCQFLKNVKTEICTYDPNDDVIASVIHKTGEWEGHLVKNLLELLRKHPHLVFLDIGCNIGVYTISAASARSKSICVDANPENLRLVAKSVSRGGFERDVTIVWNALSARRHPVNFQIVDGNAGASRIGDISKFNMTKKKDIAVNAILLDDLKWLVDGKQLVMKIDAEAHELYVLKGGLEFFRTVDVRIIQMELLEEDTFNAVVGVLNDLDFLMFRDPYGKELLSKKDFVPGIWPGDVYFIKTKYV